MSISPGSDIVMDVMRAADPAAVRRAAARLEGAARAAAPKAASAAAKAAGPAMALWERSMAAAGAAAAKPAAARGGPVRLTPADAPDPAAPARAAPRGAEAGAEGASGKDLAAGYARLEAVLLENMLNGMMGASGGSIFGSGLAGEYWKSLLAQGLAERIAQGGGLGLARSMLPRGGGMAQQAAAGLARQVERGLISAVGRTGGA